MNLAIGQENPATCRWLGLTNNACCAMTWRLGLTSARHATKTTNGFRECSISMQLIIVFTVKSFKSQHLVFKATSQSSWHGDLFFENPVLVRTWVYIMVVVNERPVVVNEQLRSGQRAIEQLRSGQRAMQRNLSRFFDSRKIISLFV